MSGTWPNSKQQVIEAIGEFFKKEPRVTGWGICLPGPVPNAGRLAEWIKSGKHADMHYLARTLDTRMNPALFAPWAKSILLFTYQYPLRGRYRHFPAYPIAAYAQGRDYHHACGDVLKRLEAFLAGQTGGAPPAFSGFTDTAPIFERDLAAQAGLGWRGKNCLLINKTHGSCFFLAGCCTSLQLPASTPVKAHCGKCRACLEACPTGALEAPGVLNAGKCLSYLTIEYKGGLSSLTNPTGGAFFGCDACQAACPRNTHSRNAQEHVPEHFDKSGRDWARILRIGGGFNRMFKGTSLIRAGRKALLRNLAFRAAHVQDTTILGDLKTALTEETTKWLKEDLKNAIMLLESQKPAPPDEKLAPPKIH